MNRFARVAIIMTKAKIRIFVRVRASGFSPQTNQIKVSIIRIMAANS